MIDGDDDDDDDGDDGGDGGSGGGHTAVPDDTTTKGCVVYIGAFYFV